MNLKAVHRRAVVLKKNKHNIVLLKEKNAYYNTYVFIYVIPIISTERHFSLAAVFNQFRIS